MKNLKFLPILILSLAAASCGEQSQTRPAAEEAREQESVKPPSGIISLEEARTDYKMYEERRIPMIRHYEDSVFRSEKIDSTFTAARYVAFDYAQLQQYMKYIEQEAENAGTSISSLRVYFSNNPDQPRFTHPRQNSVFLVPAARPDKEKDEQFGLYIQADGKPGFLSLDLQPWGPQGMGLNATESRRSEASVLSFPSAGLQGGTSLILNFGGSAPPPHN